MQKLSRHLCFVVVFFAVMAAFCAVSFAATVESDWQRFNESEISATYSGMKYYKGPIGSPYQGDLYYNDQGPFSVQFNFSGTGIKIHAINNLSDTSVTIDGTSYIAKKVSGVIFEIEGLSNSSHSILISGTNPSSRLEWNFQFDGISILKGTIPEQPSNLHAIQVGSKVDLSWTATTTSGSSIYYNIKRSTTEGGPYSTIATTSAIAYEDSSVISGLTYYYVVSAAVNGVESPNSNEASVTIKIPEISLEVTAVDKARVGEEITANIVIHNAVNICAEDIKIYYDTSRLTYLGTENVEGIKIFKEDNTTGGAIRYITASLGKVNAANGDKVLIKLKFKAIAKGEALIDITNGRIADNATLEMDVTEENCGEKTVLIEGPRDVNRSGEYTLLDLGIDAWYHGFVAADTDTSKYDADQVEDGIIDDADLTEIVNQMLKNPNYPAPTSHNL